MDFLIQDNRLIIGSEFFTYGIEIELLKEMYSSLNSTDNFKTFADKIFLDENNSLLKIGNDNMYEIIQFVIDDNYFLKFESVRLINGKYIMSNFNLLIKNKNKLIMSLRDIHLKLENIFTSRKYK